MKKAGNNWKTVAILLAAALLSVGCVAGTEGNNATAVGDGAFTVSVAWPDGACRSKLRFQ